MRHAQAFGLTLKEVNAALDLRRGGRPPCVVVTQLLDEHLAETERRINELQALRDTLCSARSQDLEAARLLLTDFFARSLPPM
ncbi:MerR family DNA-binding protein [Streptomyces sp. NPDC059688]|uniref:MerR family DNA-binding protein n=1 Tax=Streptomyces sp. NPDC059688 TaxID=3346906 RepID=UPI0036B5745A